MPTPRANRSRGGNRSGGKGGPIRYSETRSRDNGTIGTQRYPGQLGTTVCPVCELEVGVRASDGKIRNHRIGRGRKDSWPCAGSNLTPGTIKPPEEN